MSQRWQASATYTLSCFKDAENQPFSGLDIVPFTVAPRLGQRIHAMADTDQRHRAVFSGIWEVGKGFQVSGLHYFGAGIRSVHQLRRRRSERRGGRQRTAASGRHDRPAQRLHPAGAEQDRPPPAAADSARRSRGDRPHGRGVQRVQPGELYDRHAGKQCELSAALDRSIRTVQLGFRLTF